MNQDSRGGTFRNGYQPRDESGDMLQLMAACCSTCVASVALLVNRFTHQTERTVEWTWLNGLRWLAFACRREMPMEGFALTKKSDMDMTS
jgi:hypothetical protein